MARTPRKGDTFRYRGAPLGDLVPGTLVTVREVVDAGEPGAYDDSDDSVVVEWSVPAMVITGHDDDVRERRIPQLDGSTLTQVIGNPIFGQGEATRAVSFGLSDFDDIFELIAEGPPEEAEGVSADAG